MRITDLFTKDSIQLNGKASSKQQTLDAMIDLMFMTGKINNKEEYKKGVYAREEEGTTGIGEGIAIPHAKSKAVTAPGLAAMVIKDGVEFDSLDGEPVHLVFLIAAPDSKENVHLDVLSKLSVLLMDETFTANLKNAKSVDEFLSIINKAETARDQKEEVQMESKKCRILAVTACPTGIAHTYMAAESLEKKAIELGASIKVETNGSGGAKNVLTAKEIEEADGIIIAADTNVDMARFDGKKVIVTKVSAGIHKSEELVRRIMDGDASVYHHNGTVSSQKERSDEKETVGHIIYKHLMSGVSSMLPFVVGGGILIALAFLLDNVNIDPKSFGSNTPVAAFFMTTGKAAFGFMLPVLAGFIAKSIADRPGLAVGFVGGALASAGGAGFLGALVAGFAGGYLVVGLKKLFSFLPKSLEGIKPVLLYPFFGILLMGLGMTFLVNPPVAGLNALLTNGLNSMNGTSKLLFGLVLGGMMSIDFGGPINKAAYIFGVGSIASGNYNIMAAVMIGGMVPPLAIALSTFMFPKKFTKTERESGPSNVVMGFSFITEGAIPFAAADPIRVIIACAIGSAIAGSISMISNCTLMAPHGGIFVFKLVGNWPMYLVALLVGSLIGAVILGLLKKNVVEE